MLASTLLIIIFIALIYFIKIRPSYAVVYFFIFYAIIDILLDQIGIDRYRLVSRYLFVLMLLVAQRKTFSWTSINKAIQKDKITQGFLLVSLLIFFYSLFAMNENQLLRIEFRNEFFIYSLVPFFITYLIINSEARLKQVPLAIIFVGLLFFVVFYLFVDTSQIIIGDRGSFRDVGFNSITLSRISGFMFNASLLLALYGTSQNFNFRLFLIGVILLAGFMLLITSQRGTIIGVFFSLGLFSWFVPGTKFKSLLYISIIGFIITTLLFLFNIEQFGLIERFRGLENYEDFQRYEDYSRSWKIFTDHVFLGTGPKGYFLETEREFPHNIILEMMVEYGIFGLIAILLILFSGIKYSIKYLKMEYVPYQSKIIITMWLLMLISVLVSGNIITNNNFWILSALLVTVNKLYSKKNNLISNYCFAK